MRDWRHGAHIGRLYRITEENLEYSNSRIGMCAMKDRLLARDLFVCIEHSGDCFNTYQLVRMIGNGWEPERGIRLGAYHGFGEALTQTFDKSDLELLVAGVFLRRDSWNLAQTGSTPLVPLDNPYKSA